GSPPPPPPVRWPHRNPFPPPTPAPPPQRTSSPLCMRPPFRRHARERFAPAARTDDGTRGVRTADKVGSQLAYRIRRHGIDALDQLSRMAQRIEQQHLARPLPGAGGRALKSN